MRATSCSPVNLVHFVGLSREAGWSDVDTIKMIKAVRTRTFGAVLARDVGDRVLDDRWVEMSQDM